MKKPHKPASRKRYSVYLDTKISKQVDDDAKKLDINSSAYIRMLVIKEYTDK